MDFSNEMTDLEKEEQEETSDVNSKGVSWDDVFPTCDGVMSVEEFNKMLYEMRHFYDD